MVTIKSPEEIRLMKQAGRIAAKILHQVIKISKPGLSTKDLDEYAEHLFPKYKAIAAFKGYNGFPATICCSVNEELIHGIPSPKRIINSGDLISLDLGVKYNGYYADTAFSFYIGRPPKDIKHILATGKNALMAAIKVAREGITLGDLGYTIQKLVEDNGLCVVRKYVGHGIGSALHEDPEVPNFGKPFEGIVLKEGMTLAIEPMVTFKTPDVSVGTDGWTVSSKDKLPCVHFEHTVLIKKKSCDILTQ